MWRWPWQPWDGCGHRRVLPSSRQQEGEGPGAVRAAQRGGGRGRSDWTGPAAQDCTTGGSRGTVGKPHLVRN